jgi:hypothetical protein
MVRMGALGAGERSASFQDFSKAMLMRLTTVANSESFSTRGAAFFAARAELSQKPVPIRSRIAPKTQKKR